MSQDYTIVSVDEEVKEWKSQYGPMVTYRLFLEETGEEVIEQNKKPDSPAPKEGDVIYGHIERSAYGAKFKAEMKPDAPTKSGSTPKTLEYEPSTNTRWAIGMAYRAYNQVMGTPEGSKGEFPFDEVKLHASELLKMFDELKGGSQSDLAHPKTLQATQVEKSQPATPQERAKAKAKEMSNEPDEDWIPENE